MDSQYEQLTIFLDAINEEARLSTDKIMREADEFKANALEKAQQEAIEKSNEFIRYESNKLKTQSNRKVSEASKSLRKELLQQRNAIADTVFSKIIEKLQIFTDTEEYETFLINSAKQIASFYKDASFTLLLRNDDLKYEEQLTDVVKTISKIEIDNTIVIGGCKASCESSKIDLDDSLDTRLEHEKEWFYTNSGLTL